MAKVIFSVGVKHPLYNKPTEAIIDNVNCGYNGICIYAHTTKAVHYNEDPQGIGVYGNDGKLLRYETRPPYEEVWKGYVDEVLEW